MKIIDPSFEILSEIDGDKILKLIEVAGRTCYKSENKITDESAKTFVNMICNVHKHHSVLEHFSFTVKFITDRAVTHELVRHRIASFSQESQRYVNYGSEKNGSGITFVRPTFYDNKELFDEWFDAMKDAETRYLTLLSKGAKPELARTVLPNSTKTEIVVTANLREWIHILTLRTSIQAHPDIRYLMTALLDDLKKRIPVVFDTL
jgi:thymidylate synthase (FAD)